MRQLKFRAFHKKEKKMYEVDEICLECDKVKLKGFESTKEKIPMADVELMQFTGLRDKNMQEIYEGDVLKHEDLKWCASHVVSPSIVKYKEFGFYPFTDYGSDCDQYLRGRDVEIIGNIYEGKEVK